MTVRVPVATIHTVSRSVWSDSVPGAHYGLIASRDQVMRDGVTREKLRQELSVLWLEMEARRDLARLADEFKYGSDGNVGAVPGLDIEYGLGSKRAWVSI